MEMKNKALFQVHKGHKCNIELKPFLCNCESYSFNLAPLGPYIHDEYICYV